MKKKRLLVVGIVVLLAIIAVVVAVVVSRGYRVIKVEDFDGEVTLERESKEKEVFEGLKLKSEDTMTTAEDGLVELLVDDDKHILARENTCFTIQSTGNKKKGKLTIDLEYGTNLVEIENKLPEGYDVEVETPNASLSVRGTTFEVEYIPETNTTIVAVTEGKVRAESKADSLDVEAGLGAIIEDDVIILTDLTAQQNPSESEANTPADNTGNPFSKVYIMSDEFPGLIKGGSSYDQMRYMIKIALVADMEGHSDYLKEALYLMCYEGYQTDIFPPVDGTENVYEIEPLNNMFSFLTDEKIEEKHLNAGSTIGESRLTTYRDPEVLNELTAVGLASSYYGENEEIVIEFIAEKHTIVDRQSGPILEYKGTAYLVKDETDKYVFDHLEWEER